MPCDPSAQQRADESNGHRGEATEMTVAGNGFSDRAADSGDEQQHEQLDQRHTAMVARKARVRGQKSGARSQEPGARSQEPGVRRNTSTAKRLCRSSTGMA